MREFSPCSFYLYVKPSFWLAEGLFFGGMPLNKNHGLSLEAYFSCRLSELPDFSPNEFLVDFADFPGDHNIPVAKALLNEPKKFSEPPRRQIKNKGCFFLF